jgi:hypothetical protein
LVDAGHLEAAQVVTEMVYDRVATKMPESPNFSLFRSALAVWNSLGDYAKSFVRSPLVRDDPALKTSLDAVKLATCPLTGGHDSRLEDLTGWDRKDCPHIRERRLNPRAHQHTSGTLVKLRKRSKRSAMWLERKVEAQKFWIRKTSPKNLGVGKRDLVCALSVFHLTFSFVL